MTNTKQDWLDELLYQNIQFTELGHFPEAVPKDRHWVNVMGKIYSFDFTLAKQAIAKQIEKEVVEAYKQGYIDGGIGVMNETANYHPKQSKEANDEVR